MAKVKLTDYYNQCYRNSIQSKWTFTNPDKTLKEVADLLTSGKGLDIGCGLGRNCLHMARNGLCTKAVDLSKIAVEYVKSIAAQENLPIEVACCNILWEKLACEYDLVNACWILDEFSKENAHWLIRRMQDATIPGGINCIVTTAKGTIKGNMRAPSGHHFFTPNELTRLYVDAGWEIRSCSTMPEHLGRSEVLAIRFTAWKPAA